MVFWAHLGPEAAMELGSLPAAVDGGGFAVCRALTRGGVLAEKKREGNRMVGHREESGEGLFVITERDGTRSSVGITRRRARTRFLGKFVLAGLRDAPEPLVPLALSMADCKRAAAIRSNRSAQVRSY